MAKKAKVLDGTETVTETAPAQGKKAGRPAFPRDENGKIIRPEGYQPKHSARKHAAEAVEVLVAGNSLTFQTADYTVVANRDYCTWVYPTTGPVNLADCELGVKALSGLPEIPGEYSREARNSFVEALRARFALDLDGLIAVDHWLKQ